MKCKYCSKKIPHDSEVCPHCNRIVRRTDHGSRYARIKELATHKLLHPIVLCSILALTLLLRTMGLHSELESFPAFLLHAFFLVLYILFILFLMDKTLSGGKSWEFREKNRVLILWISCAVFLVSVSLNVVYVIKREYVLDHMPSTGTVHVKVSVDAEYYTVLEDGYINDPYTSLEIDDTHLEKHSVWEVELDRVYQATVTCGYRGGSNKRSGKGTTEIELAVLQSMLQQQEKINVELVLNDTDSAVVTLSFEWFPTFWDVLFF